jgi:hypothetical protein
MAIPYFIFNFSAYRQPKSAKTFPPLCSTSIPWITFFINTITIKSPATLSATFKRFRFNAVSFQGLANPRVLFLIFNNMHYKTQRL